MWESEVHMTASCHPLQRPLRYKNNGNMKRLIGRLFSIPKSLLLSVLLAVILVKGRYQSTIFQQN